MAGGKRTGDRESLFHKPFRYRQLPFPVLVYLRMARGAEGNKVVQRAHPAPGNGEDVVKLKPFLLVLGNTATETAMVMPLKDLLSQAVRLVPQLVVVAHANLLF